MIDVWDYVGKDIALNTFVLRFAFTAERCVAQLQQLENCDAVHTFLREFIRDKELEGA